MKIAEVIGDYEQFVLELIRRCGELGIDLKDYPIDHICYRVNSLEEYSYKSSELINLSSWYAESFHNGRSISKFVLSEPLEIDKYQISVIELPAPKEGASYKSGLEHAEFVVSDLGLFVNKYGDIFSGQEGGSNNLTYSIKLKGSKSVKFHAKPLLEVIQEEGQVLQKI